MTASHREPTQESSGPPEVVCVSLWEFGTLRTLWEDMREHATALGCLSSSAPDEPADYAELLTAYEALLRDIDGRYSPESGTLTYYPPSAELERCVVVAQEEDIGLYALWDRPGAWAVAIDALYNPLFGA